MFGEYTLAYAKNVLDINGFEVTKEIREYRVRFDVFWCAAKQFFRTFIRYPIQINKCWSKTWGEKVPKPNRYIIYRQLTYTINVAYNAVNIIEEIFESIVVL